MSLPRRNGKGASNLHSNRLQIASADNMTKCHALPKRLQVNRNNTTLGVVSSKQLDHVRTFIAQPSQNDSLTSARALDDGKNAASTLEPREYHLSQEDEKIINAVMLKVAELNVDKLPDSSLVKVLTSIYLDARSKLENKKTSMSTGSCDKYLSTSGGGNNFSFEQEQLRDELNRPQDNLAPLSVLERKRIQWEAEKAELTKIGSYDPWEKFTPANISRNLNGRTAFYPPNPTAPVMVDSMGSSYTAVTSSSSSIAVTTSHAPSFTPVAFAASEDAESLKREMERRRWKAELDEQVRQRRLLQEKQRLEDCRRHVAIHAPIQHLPSVSAYEPPSSTPSGSTKAFPSDSTHPHPSDSHFLPSTLVPDVMYPIPAPVMKPQFPPTRLSDQNSNAELHFHRTRGFTHELYSSPADEAARMRRAQEISRINLEQIEEKRRQKEEEKARRLREERLEEARLEQERARLTAIAEAELRERQVREAEEDEKNKILIDALQRAREEATIQKRQMLFERLHSKGQELCEQTDYGSSNHRLMSSPKCVESPAQRSTSHSPQLSKQQSTQTSSSPGVHRSIPDVVPSVVTLEEAACQTAPWDGTKMLHASSKTTSKSSVVTRGRREASKIGGRTRDHQNSLTKSTKLLASGSQAKTHLSCTTDDLGMAPRLSAAPSNKLVKPHDSSASVGSGVARLGSTYTRAFTGPCGPREVSGANCMSRCGRMSDIAKPSIGQNASTAVRCASDSGYPSNSSSDKSRTRIPVPVANRSSSTNQTRPNLLTPIPSSPPSLNRGSDVHPPTYQALNLIRTDDVLPPRQDAGAVGRSFYKETHLGHGAEPCSLDMPPHNDAKDDRRIERQNTILQHLSEIRKGLRMRQMLCESGTYDDDDDADS